jgi:hypothetical protein
MEKRMPRAASAFRVFEEKVNLRENSACHLTNILYKNIIKQNGVILQPQALTEETHGSFKSTTECAEIVA